MTTLTEPASPVAQGFTPKLVSVLREGYHLRHLRADALAGLTVAIVALPLSMAIAIASGTTPDRGLYAAIIGGFIVSALGGSRFQIGGPAGAYIVLVSATLARHGLEGFLLASLISGFILLLLGALRLGSFIRFIPYPVTVGFTAGIGVIIFASQLHDLFGLKLAGPEPGEIAHKLVALGEAVGTANPQAMGIAGFTILAIVLLRRFAPRWPALMIAVAAAALLAGVLNLPVETIGTRFGELPRGLPLPALPSFSPDLALAVLPDAMAFALLGAIESLLSAVVADGMTGRRHRSNGELVAQGFANIASALFGGITVTGTIARTATNIRAGAHGPVAGMLHAVFLLVFMLVAAPLASFIPLAALAGILAVVAWGMIERHAVTGLVRGSRGDGLVLGATFVLTVLVDVMTGIAAGVALAALTFMVRTGQATRLEPEQSAPDQDVAVYSLSGAVFFGTAARIGILLDSLVQGQTLIVDCTRVTLLDSSGARVLHDAIARAARAGGRLIIAGLDPASQRLVLLQGHGASPAAFASGLAQARTMAAQEASQPLPV